MLLSLYLPPLHLQVLLHIEEKLFAYLHQAVFREDDGRAVSAHFSTTEKD